MYLCIELLFANTYTYHIIFNFLNQIRCGPWKKNEKLEKKNEKRKLEKLDEELNLEICGSSTQKKRQLVPEEV